MTDESEREIPREEEEYLATAIEWPEYYVSGEEEDSEDFVPAYWKVDGPSGPVWYCNQNTEPHPVTMYEFAMEPRSFSFRDVDLVETPWGDTDDE